jgi:DNA-binding MarR family transcriptional regulator
MWVLINRTTSGDFFRTVDELQLSLTQLKALHVVQGAGEPSVKDVADALHLSLPAASRALDGLVKRGLLDRRECADDRRSRRVLLTEKGSEAVQRMAEARMAGLTQFVELLEEPERAALSAALVPVIKRIRT